MRVRVGGFFPRCRGFGGGGGGGGPVLELGELGGVFEDCGGEVEGRVARINSSY